MFARKSGFTLAEVLIVLGIIGIVAALTIPGLMKKINSFVVGKQEVVLQNKIVQGLNLLNSQEQGLNKEYANSEEFVRALSKYMKMTAICSKDNLDKCFTYNEVAYEANGEIKTKELTSITDSAKLGLEEGFLPPAGFIMGDGTPVIVSWNNNCGGLTDENGKTVIDPDRVLKSIPVSCLDGVYDINGSRKPNMYGDTKDIRPFGIAKIGSKCTAEIGDLCITGSAFIPETGLSQGQCETLKNSGYPMDHCPDLDNSGGDYWAAAVQICQDSGGHLPSTEDLKTIAEEIYGGTVCTSPHCSTSLPFNKDSLAAQPFLDIYNKRNNIYLFSSVSNDKWHQTEAYGREFYSTRTQLRGYSRSNNGIYYICISNNG